MTMPAPLFPILPTGLVRGVSTPRLAGEVAAELPPGVNKAVIEALALDGHRPVSVVEVLLRLGQSVTPPVPTTGGVYSFHWPMLKYLHFFEEVGGSLCAGGEAQWYVHHGRTAVSDELGAAFSLLAGEWWLQSLNLQGFSVHDVEGCLTGRHGGPAPAVAQRTGYSRRPDWIISGLDASGARQYFVLESKGASRGSERQHIKTLASAVEQLEGITVNGQLLPGLAVRTVSGVGPIEFWAVDPPTEKSISVRTDNQTVKKFQEEHLEVLKARPKKQATRPGDEKENIRADELMGYAALTQAAKLAQWAAEPDLLDKLLRVPSLAKSPRFLLDLGGETAVGSLTRIPGEPLVLFTGILRKLEEPLRDMDFEGVDKEQSTVEPESFKALRGLADGQVSVAGNGMVTAVLPADVEGTRRLRSE